MYFIYLSLFITTIIMYFRAKRNVTMTNHISGGSWYLIKKDNIYKGEYIYIIHKHLNLKLL